MKTLGQRIRNRRIDLDMTQEELAKKMGYKNKSTIGKIESDVNDITTSKVVEFAHALDTTVAYIMGWEEDAILLESNEPGNDTEKLLNLWNQMDDSQKHMFLSLGRALLYADNQQTD